jgi:hypothetical protein
MYRAKEMGRNAYRFHSPVRERNPEHAQKSSGLPGLPNDVGLVC